MNQNKILKMVLTVGFWASSLLKHQNSISVGEKKANSIRALVISGSGGISTPTKKEATMYLMAIIYAVSSRLIIQLVVPV